MPRYKVIAGQHMHFDKLYKKGDVVETDLDLLHLFKNKFQRVHEQSTIPVKLEIDKDPDADDKTVDGSTVAHTNPPGETTPKVNPGVNVTKNFESAVDEDFLVFREKGGKHFIFDPDAPETALNKKPLKRSEVEAFITKHLEE